ncbi:hypothetical protein X805_27120 [Sphaerotilus natans subsp. natans DSM 6575]|uniref:Uncharacterized protein n=1 Tax=Sphaerotilus natans subsp. natans DSM 6575 TaxID=1286631 RepID=A0A059KJY4_9BURK|nr:hypothetical protein X805_27120 [Sphaerotilus natans subsp. natans DSM 6575]
MIGTGTVQQTFDRQADAAFHIKAEIPDLERGQSEQADCCAVAPQDSTFA